MKVIINKYDNGISWDEVDHDKETSHVIMYDSDINREIGKIIASDIDAVMNESVTNRVELEYNIKVKE